MRRVLVFLLVFGAGLALVAGIEWLRRRSQPAETGRPQRPTAPVERPPGPEQKIELPVETEDGSGQKGVDFAVSGPAEFTDLGPDGRPLWRLTGEVSLPGGDVILMSGVRVVAFREGSDQARLRLDAASARARIDTSRQPPGPDPTAVIPFTDVHLVAIDYGPMTPIEVSVPTLSGTLAAKSFSSSDRVVADGRGVHLEGSGLELEPERLALGSDVAARIALAGGGEVVLRCAGRLTVERFLALGEDGVRITARGGARLVTETAELAGETIRVSGRALEAAGGRPARFLPISAESEDRALLDLDGDLFRADSGRVQFDSEGLPSRAVLEGSPAVDFALGAIDPETLPFELPPDTTEIRVRAHGPGPLVIELGQTGTFDFAGPVHVEIDALGAELDARQRLFGRRHPSGPFELLSAEGRVHARMDELELESASVRVTAPDGDASRLAVEADGPSHSTGTLEGGEPYELDVAGLALLSRRQDAVLVRRAEGVDLWIGPPGGPRTWARADRITDLDLDSLALDASGDVRVEGPSGKGRSERVHSDGERVFELSGTVDAPARFETEEGWLTALLVVASPSRVVAGGDARAELELEGRTWSLDGARISLERRPWRGPSGEARERLRLEADGRAHVTIVEGDQRAELSADAIAADALRTPGPGPEQELPLELGQIEPGLLVARGRVVLSGSAGLALEARGEHLVLTRVGSGILSGSPEERVWASGTLDPGGAAFDLDATRVVFGPEAISADQPLLEISGVDLPLGPIESSGTETIQARGSQMVLDRSSLTLSGAARVERHAPDQEVWSIDAGSVRLSAPAGTDLTETQTSFADTVTMLVAWDGYVAHLGRGVSSAGESLIADRESGHLTVRGWPATVETPELVGEADWIEWDTETGLLRSDVGRITSRAGVFGEEPWAMTFSGLEPLPQEDVAIQIVRQPIIRQGESVVRAAWAVFWVDPDEWAGFSRHYVEGRQEREPFRIRDVEADRKRRERRMPSLIAPLRSTEAARWLREGYIEGDIEYYVENGRLARADAMYLDLADGHGWIENLEIRQPLPFAGGDEEVEIKIEWVRHSADGSLRADDAVISTCTFEKPHYRIESGDLRLVPRPPKRGQEPFWELTFKKNAVVIGDWLRLPLPGSPAIPLDRRGRLNLTEAPEVVREAGQAVEAVAGQTGRFGSFFRLGFVTDFSWLRRGLPRLLGADPDKAEGSMRYELGYLGSRGGLVGLRPSVREPGLYFLDLDVDLVYDTGQDRGLQRVPENERSDLRSWVHLRGRYEMGPSTWLDVIFSKQSDAGVQSEFWEGDFLRFEESETFAHLRHASGRDYAHLRARPRTNDFKTEVEELPEAGWYRGRAEVGHVGSVPLVYSSDSEAGYYQRREGDPRFSLTYPDGLGSFDVLRADTRQRLESPFALGVAGARAVPFLEGRLTAWDQGDPTSPDGGAPLRAGLLGGVEVTALFWRPVFAGLRHEIVPRLGYRSDIALAEDGPPPVAVDSTELPIGGQFVDFGLRQRLVTPDADTSLDLDLRMSWADGTAGGLADGWLPLAVLGDLYTSLGPVPVAVHHDARYDLDDHLTPYSRTLLGFEPIPSVGIELGYHHGLDTAGTVLFDAYTALARWRSSPKWEFEGGTTLSTLTDASLDSFGLVRRFGHDVVFEIELSHREGEGSAFQIGLQPVISWHSRTLGLLGQRREARW